MKRTIIATAAVGALLLTGCSRDQSKADLAEPDVSENVQPESYVATVPDKVEIISNVDDHPTIVRLCIDGTAWRTISKSHSGLASPALDRVPEWDGWCE
jgi:PBP1b-binding outer membrane lipoprotein LpoB